MSAALRWVVSGFDVVSAGRASSIWSTGAVIAPKESTTSAIARPGTFWTKRTHRLPMVGPRRRLPLRVGLPATPGIRPLKALSPSKPSIAGMSVSETKTAIATVPAAAKPMAVRKPMRAMMSAKSAVKTVAPAKTTEEPAVPTAMPAASGPSMRRRSAR